ncbi:hypothetical protein [Kineosporia sp. NBRC 101731]|uniref:hypothetical protein n=1 Tax=Kineosporia sp. NBRC 101731 TaxID=3032199 RepID=UPI0024A0B9D6|nr:hypothetical protein [Kineosporia sp. NBRC 101731]GLY33341.1 hypothetical protein Kisp02_67060 [Kineosporia sp. NBRC 101731]
MLEAVLLIIVLIAAVVVMGLTLRVVITAVKQSRRGYVPTEEQRQQIMKLGGAGLILTLIVLLIPSLF